MAQIGLHSPGPRIACPRTGPSLALRHFGVFELVEGQVFGLAFDGDIAAGAHAARHREITGDVDRVVSINNSVLRILAIAVSFMRFCPLTVVRGRPCPMLKLLACPQ
jgi:hypothetical protein